MLSYLFYKVFRGQAGALERFSSVSKAIKTADLSSPFDLLSGADRVSELHV